MPCGKRPLVKLWDKPRKISSVKPSKYEQKEASVKLHWKKVVRTLEESCKEDNFWETQTEKVKELVDPVIFERLVKIFNLPKVQEKYTVRSRQGSLVPSEEILYHPEEITEEQNEKEGTDKYSMSDFVFSVATMKADTIMDESTTTDSVLSMSKSFKINKSTPKSLNRISLKNKIQIKETPSVFSKHSSYTSRAPSMGFDSLLQNEILDTSTTSNDDLEVQVPIKERQLHHFKNVHYNLLYCSKSETDMISWKSKYRQKTEQISSSDECNKKAEVTTRKIASDFYEWWENLGTAEYKSEIKSTENIEDLFQIWFNEHASTSLVVDPKIIPCVLETVAKAAHYPKSSCPNVLKKNVAFDIKAEQSPPHIKAFGTSLPQKKKHIPPNNETKKSWGGPEISEDLRTMACVWEDIGHLTSTKSYYNWLMKRPSSQIPLIFEDLYGEHHRRRRASFVVPSDLVLTGEKSSTLQFQLPVSQLNVDMKEYIDKLRTET